MSNTHSRSQAKVTNMSKPVFGDKFMSKTLSKSQIKSHNHFYGSILIKSMTLNFDTIVTLNILNIKRHHCYLSYKHISVLLLGWIMFMALMFKV